MFRRSGLLVAIIAIIVVLTVAVTVFAQSGGTPTDSDTSNFAPTATLSSESSSTGSGADDSSDPALEESPTTPVPASDDSESLPTNTPADLAQDEGVSVAPLTPFTPRVPEGTGAPAQQIEAPLQLQIPAIGVDTQIEWVGVDDEGNMDVPSTYRTVAWYEPGPRPGMTGNAVVAGHLDSQTGPAVFYRLGDLQPGDEIVVISHNGEELRFAVTGMERFNSQTAPVYDIFGPSSGRNLNLITCEGTFDPAAGQYDERLVVYTTLISG